MQSIYLNASNSFGSTAFHVVNIDGHTEVVKLLSDLNIDLNAKTVHGKTRSMVFFSLFSHIHSSPKMVIDYNRCITETLMYCILHSLYAYMRSFGMQLLLVHQSFEAFFQAT